MTTFDSPARFQHDARMRKPSRAVAAVSAAVGAVPAVSGGYLVYDAHQVWPGDESRSTVRYAAGSGP